ncbi:hypothetical protein D3C80_1401760 [compost metagenome]
MERTKIIGSERQAPMNLRRQTASVYGKLDLTPLFRRLRSNCDSVSTIILHSPLSMPGAINTTWRHDECVSPRVDKWL